MEKKSFIPDWLYNILKWFCMIASPAICTFIVTLANLWKWDIPTEAIVGTIAALTALIGALIGISSVQYSKTKDESETLTSIIQGLGKVLQSADVQKIINKSADSDEDLDQPIEGAETGTATVDETVEIIEAPEGEEGRG